MRKLAALLLIALLSAPAFAADKITTVPVKFAHGATGTTVSGSVQGYDTVAYMLAAKARQTISLKLSGTTNAYFNLFAPDVQESLSLESDGQSFTGKLPATGNYRIQVYQPRAQARRNQVAKYTLRIDIR